MTPKTPQCKVFWSLLLNSKHLGVPEDSKSPTLGVRVSSSHFTQNGVATIVNSSPTPRYFVEISHNLVALTINHENDKLVMNLEDPNLKIK